MPPRLPPDFLNRPIAHRALHDLDAGRPENSLSAIEAAIEAGFGIEIDLQLSADRAAMVFHDYDMVRLTGQSGTIQTKPRATLQSTPLLGGGEGIPTLSQTLELVAGRVPLLIEIKDQDGALGPNVGPLEHAAVAALGAYTGPVALMSFNPHSIALVAELAPHIPRGLTTDSFASWPGVSTARCAELAQIQDLDRVGASFISHHWQDLANPRVQEIAQSGLDILCWTVRSAEDEAQARRVAANVTFEGYLPA